MSQVKQEVILATRDEERYNVINHHTDIPGPGRFMSDDPAYESLYLKGIHHFNDCEFFEAHDVWEELWSDHQGPSRKFYQGLIQVAVCLHHFGNGNTRGAKKLFNSSRDYLVNYGPFHLGLNVEKLIAEMEVCCAKILASEEQFPKIEIEADLIPEIHLDPPPASSSDNA